MSIKWGASAKDRKMKHIFEQIEKILEGMPSADVLWLLKMLEISTMRSVTASLTEQYRGN